MNETEKELGAVAMMRVAREENSAEIEGLTPMEELKWLASPEIENPLLKRLRGRAAQQFDAAALPAADRRSTKG
ncbi:MAG: hypothetical protein AB7O52_04045 [Planctomycetota bacterium]